MKKSIIKKYSGLIAVLIVSFGLILSLAGCSRDQGKQNDDPKSLEKIVEEMAVDYGSYGMEAKDKIGSLLEELSEADKSAGARWAKIMDIWMSDDLGRPLNYDVLPDGLPGTDELCLVVLGFQLEPDGSMKPELVERLLLRRRQGRDVRQRGKEARIIALHRLHPRLLEHDLREPDVVGRAVGAPGQVPGVFGKPRQQPRRRRGKDLLCLR